MKIAYVTLHWPRTISSSVGKKILRQTAQWRSMGHTVKFFSHLHAGKNQDNLVEGELFFYPVENGLIRREFGRISAAKHLIQSLRVYSPDIIYLRWAMYTAPLNQIFSIAPLVLEINTNDKKEHKHLGIVLDLYNRITRSIFLRSANGLIFTSHELAQDKAFTAFKKDHEVITNGINLDEVPFYPAPLNTHPHLIFLGTPGMAWHGINKLQTFAKKNPDIIIDIVGPGQDAIQGPIPPNLFLHGYLRGEVFERVLANADAAIGSLSLHVNEMNEASPFKMRDCAGRGIPLILPFFDTDLSTIQSDAILKIPNTPDNLITHNQIIHDFVYAMRGKRLSRKLIIDRIDIANKEQNRVSFFKKILDQSSD